jgi:hypothetical protein
VRCHAIDGLISYAHNSRPFLSCRELRNSGQREITVALLSRGDFYPYDQKEAPEDQDSRWNIDTSILSVVKIPALVIFISYQTFSFYS